MKAVMDRFEGLTLHRLTPADTERGFALSTEIGWNQTTEDWRYMLEHGEGFGRTDTDGKLIASAMALPYGAFGWVCMVLVSPDHRRRGIAKGLMDKVVTQLADNGIVAGLDATPAGREVYSQIGFDDVYGLKRMELQAAAQFTNESERTPVRIEPITPDQMDEVSNYDSVLFGGDRSALLRHLHGRQPNLAFAAWAGQWMAGYVLGRDGRVATQIGPVVAEDDDIAVALAERALRNVKGPVFIDATERNVTVVEWLLERGFQHQRPYTRMLYNRREPFDDAERIFAVAGPELG